MFESKIKRYIEDNNIKYTTVLTDIGKGTSSTSILPVLRGENYVSNLNFNTILELSEALDLSFEDMLEDFELDGSLNSINTINHHIKKILKHKDTVSKDGKYQLSKNLERIPYNILKDYMNFKNNFSGNLFDREEAFLDKLLKEKKFSTREDALLAFRKAIHQELQLKDKRKKNLEDLNKEIDSEKIDEATEQANRYAGITRKLKNKKITPRFMGSSPTMYQIDLDPDNNEYSVQVGCSYMNHQGELIKSEIIGCRFTDKPTEKHISYFAKEFSDYIDVEDLNNVNATETEISKKEFYRRFYTHYSKFKLSR